MNTIKLIEKLKEIEPQGIEVSTRMGFLSTTKAIYYFKNKFYIFSLEDKFDFEESNSMDLEQFKNNYSKWNWEIEQIIS